MTQPYKDGISVCKTIMRNGFDAYVINARIQGTLLQEGEKEIDIATDMGLDELMKLFPHAGRCTEEDVTASMQDGETCFRFYLIDEHDGAHPETVVRQATPRILQKLKERNELPADLACPYIPQVKDLYEGFADMADGVVAFCGNPDETLRRNYILGVRALRFAANYGLPVEDNTWTAILRAGSRILDYVPVHDIMDEWRKVEAENMWLFVRLLFDSMLLHGLIPELAALSRVRHLKDGENEETVLDHTITMMKHYPEELAYDWFGTLACMFHDVGKLFTAEFYDDKWHFHQHHRVGAQVTRKILNRLGMMPADIDLLCHLVRQHMRFHFMLTDRGIRRFKALNEYPRLIEMARADIKARGIAYTDFNHNMKMLERADTPEEMLEPLLNGNEIMEFTQINPGPQVGILREALLKAQVAGEVTSVPEAVEFVIRHKQM